MRRAGSGPEAQLPQPVAIFGCGLIGASLAGALSRRGVTCWGCDRRPLDALVSRGWLTKQVAAEDLALAPLVVLALPVEGILAALRRLPFRPGQLLTDTASVKGVVLAAAADLGPGVRFVAGHPMAGAAAGGFEAARADLFDGASWALSGSPGAADRRQVEALIRLVGATPFTCDAFLHDRIVALSSHLPQLFATCLAAELAESDEAELVERLMGPAARSLLRLAASPFSTWKGVLEHNEDAVGRALAAVCGRAQIEPAALEETFDRAREIAARCGLGGPSDATGEKSE